ncbi:MAG: hypothetical protein A3E88_00695 [Legionellales bacterium RIFCSPHIGHO2_12_FULL_35_11]|nr:MAG: hypothetical protein A3E88_00695 [Legionellales bacterium RIFCSPHIGHO2_12_FULL_35_11]
MQHYPKSQIYRGMIQYLLEFTSYTLKDIADLTNSSTKSIRSIHCLGKIPENFQTELNLVKLYHMILALDLDQSSATRLI